VSGSHLLLVSNDDTRFEGDTHILYRDTCVLTVAIKESGLEVNNDNTEYVVMSYEQNIVQNHG